MMARGSRKRFKPSDWLLKFVAPGSETTKDGSEVPQPAPQSNWKDMKMYAMMCVAASSSPRGSRGRR